MDNIDIHNLNQVAKPKLRPRLFKDLLAEPVLDGNQVGLGLCGNGNLHMASLVALDKADALKDDSLDVADNPADELPHRPAADCKAAALVGDDNLLEAAPAL